jgi:hypothetical protein
MGKNKMLRKINNLNFLILLFALMALMGFNLISGANLLQAQTSYSIWPNPVTPVGFFPEAQSVEVGLKFRVNSPGYITGIRFHKDALNTGTHVGNLWTSAGTNLASVTFIEETASGWQQMALPSPVLIAANTTYVVSYHTDAGESADPGFFSTQSVVNGPLTALQNGGTDGFNGVYSVGLAPGTFPNLDSSGANYWVDVVFTPLPLTLTTSSLPNGVQGVAYTASLAASGGIGAYTWSIASGNLPANLSLNTSTGAITGTPTAAGTSNFTVQVTDSATPTPVTTTKALSIIIAGPLTITTVSLPNGVQGVAYTASLAASGGNGATPGRSRAGIYRRI